MIQTSTERFDVPPQRTDLLILHDLQQLCLQRIRQEPDLVEEDRAAVGGGEKPRLRLTRIGEGAALEAEHLRFHQRLRDGGAVHVDERPPGARAFGMEHACDQALAGSGFSQQQQGREAPRGGIAADDLPHLSAQGDETRARPDEIAEAGRHEARIIPGRPNQWCKFHRWCTDSWSRSSPAADALAPRTFSSIRRLGIVLARGRW